MAREMIILAIEKREEKACGGGLGYGRIVSLRGLDGNGVRLRASESRARPVSRKIRLFYIKVRVIRIWHGK